MGRGRDAGRPVRGAVAGPLAVGLLAHDGHFELGWIACSVFALLAGATVLAVRRAGYRS